jgi:hypothetical protein
MEEQEGQQEEEEQDEEHSIFERSGTQKSEVMHGCLRCSYNAVGAGRRAG